MMSPEQQPFTEPPEFSPEHIGMRVFQPDRMEEWSHLWQPGESMWQGKLSKHLFRFSCDREIITDVKNFFRLRAHKMDIPADYEWNNSSIPDANRYENFVKMVWLTYEYHQNGFRHSLGSHWNPRVNAISIHPGGCRNKIVKLFLPDDGLVDVHFFNTGGFFSEWMKDLKKIEDHAYFTKIGWVSGVSPDHGTLIPHPMCPHGAGALISSEKARWYENICEQLNSADFTIWLSDNHMLAKTSIPWLSDWVTMNKNKAAVLVHGIDQAPSEIDAVAITLLILSQTSASYKGFTVECQSHKT